MLLINESNMCFMAVLCPWSQAVNTLDLKTHTLSKLLYLQLYQKPLRCYNPTATITSPNECQVSFSESSTNYLFLYFTSHVFINMCVWIAKYSQIYPLSPAQIHETLSTVCQHRAFLGFFTPTDQLKRAWYISWKGLELPLWKKFCFEEKALR